LGFVGTPRNVEAYITHNGDLDFFIFHGVTYALGDVQRLLARLLGRPTPSEVDSASVAGLLELLRAKGMWLASVRYGYLFGALATAGSLAAIVSSLASAEQLAALAAQFEEEWKASLASAAAAERGTAAAATVEAGAHLEQLQVERERMERRMCARVDALAKDGGALPLPGVLDRRAAVNALVQHACDAFMHADLLRAALELMNGARGSFGLVLSHSLDAEEEMVVAARGQTMSLAVYPQSGLVAFGSEAAATKVGMGAQHGGAAEATTSEAAAAAGSFRFDLDDCTGEVVLLRWGGVAAGGGGGQVRAVCCAGRVYPACVLSSVEGDRQLVGLNLLEHGEHAPIWQRRLQLDGNPLLSALPAAMRGDVVGADLLAIPAALERLTHDFDSREHSANRLTAWTFTSKLRQKMRAHRAGTHDGSVDVLITGCEVSLWVGEQFAADLQLLYPTLRILTLSANKLLGQLGQAMPIAQTGFCFSDASHNLRGAIVLVLSHSGGTFAPLACCSLLRGFTQSIFVVCSEADTQAARAVRSAATATDAAPAAAGDADADADAADATATGASTNEGAEKAAAGPHDRFVSLASQYVFSTHTGFRPAEPCSLTVVATHHLLSQLLLFLAAYLSHFEHGEHNRSICGSNFCAEEVRELAMINRRQSHAAAQLVGERSLGDTPTSAALRAQGHRWARHVLEGPLAWILSLAYIALTVMLGGTPLSALATIAAGEPLPAPLAAAPLAAANVSALLGGAAGGAPLSPERTALAPPAWLWAVRHAVGLADVVIYAFLGWWTTVLLRLVQRRPWHHRVAGRSVLIGDVPWVSQCAEAFASKLFALSYSIASCSFASANPSDHLVHRHTHRVVRGSLLAVGRPDGRANAMTSAEAACTLSVNQASSIQNMGVTCESVTIGHSSYQLPLSSSHVVLPTSRPPWACEALRELDDRHPTTPASSCFPTPHPSVHGTPAGALSALSTALARIATDPSVHGGRQALDAFAQAFRGNSEHNRGLCASPTSMAARSRSSSQNHLALLEALAAGSSSPQPRHSNVASAPSCSTSAHGGHRFFSSPRLSPSLSPLASPKPSLATSPRLSPKSTPHPSREASNDRGLNLLPIIMRGSSARLVSASSSAFAESSAERLLVDDIARPDDSLLDGEGTGGMSGAGEEAGRQVLVVRVRRTGEAPLPSPLPSPPSTPPARKVTQSTSSREANGNGSSADAPNAMKASISRLGKRSRRLFDRAAGRFDSLSLAAFQRAVYQLEPIDEPFLGAWMLRDDAHQGLDSSDIMQRQQLVQTLSESRFDSMQRLIAFYVLFHAMGQAVQDFWPAATCGIFGYDMSRTQSIMRVATTASPVSGMEVRERLLAIQAETRRAHAASRIQRSFRGVRLGKWLKAQIAEARAKDAV